MDDHDADADIADLLARGAQCHMAHGQVALRLLGDAGVHVGVAPTGKKKNELYVTDDDQLWVKGATAHALIRFHMNGVVHEKLGEALDRLSEGDSDIDSKAAKIMAFYGNETNTNHVIGSMMSILCVRQSGDFVSMLDKQPDIFSLAGKNVVDFQDGSIRARRHDDYVTKCAGFDAVDTASGHYAEGVQFWTSTLVKQLGAGPGLTWFLVHLGYCMTGHTTEKCFVFVKGPKNTGKSNFRMVLGRLLGDYHRELHRCATAWARPRVSLPLTHECRASQTCVRARS
jgi:phage/plasmid-associated DNA primase